LRDTLPELKGEKKFTDGSVTYLPEEGSAIFIGDTHGQSSSIRAVIEQSHFAERLAKGENVQLVLLGDYVDRGFRQLENLEQVLDLKTKFPDNVVILRGNHETQTTTDDDFQKELEHKYGKTKGKETFDYYQKFFNKLGLAAVTSNGVVAVHGCVGDFKSLKDMNDPKNLMDIIWSDPKNSNGYDPDRRGPGGGHHVGEDIRKAFLERIGAKIIVRGHEAEYAYISETNNVFSSQNVSKDGKVLTVFTSRGSVKYPSNKPICYAEIDLKEDLDKIKKEMINIIDYDKIKTKENSIRGNV
jgi:predicted phosphodiesterase